MASASASAVSAGRGGSSIRSSRITMAVTWSLPARPLPVTAAFTSLGVCSATGSPRRAAHTTATAPACAVPITVRTLCWLNTRSTAIASGWYTVSHSSIPASSASSRAAMSSPAGVRRTSAATRAGARPGAPSITPSPHRVSPGSTPSTRMPHHPGRSPQRTCVRCDPTGRDRPGARGPAACRPAASAELFHDVVGDGVVRVDVLHVVGVLERLDQPEHPLGLILVQVDLDGGQERGLGRLVLQARIGHRVPHRDQVVRLADHLERLAEVGHVLRAGVQHGGEHVVLAHPVGLGDEHHPLAMEQVGDRARVGHRPPVAGERGPHVGGGPVPVVGEALHQHRNAAGRIPLVGDVLVGGAARLQPGAAADRPVDVVVRYRALLRLLDRVVQGGVAGRVGAAGARRHLDVLDQLGEKLAAPGVHDRLLVLGRRPLRMATHVRSLTMSTKSRWMRTSPVSSGWKEVASSSPCRTATILPVAGSVPRTSTCPPVCSTHGARMNTARNGACRPGAPGGPAIPVMPMSLSKESTWRPNAFRRTVMSIPPTVSWPSTPSSRRSASMIIPAQDPNTGRPAPTRLRSGSIRSKITASFHIVVDSPPGMTSASMSSSSSARRTVTGLAPKADSARACSATSPCKPSTPMTGPDPTSNLHHVIACLCPVRAAAA